MGDWFLCDSEDCLDLDDDGLRFTADGHVVELDEQRRDAMSIAPSFFSYCAEDVLGSFVLTKDGLTLIQPDGDQGHVTLEWFGPDAVLGYARDDRGRIDFGFLIRRVAPIRSAQSGRCAVARLPTQPIDIDLESR